MIKLFRKTRYDLMENNKTGLPGEAKAKTGKYLKYAIGEIVLVVIGILIALQINNWNESRKLKLTEINVLEGIRKDILNDTTDLNFNIRAYQKVIKQDSMIINRLIDKTDVDKKLINDLNYSVIGDWSIILHESRFQEAKLKGLSIISNESLRDQINNLYEFQYRYLLMLENENELFNDTKNLFKSLGKYLSVDSTGVTMTRESFHTLLEDENSIYFLHTARENRKFLLKMHLKTLASSLKLADTIKNEIDVLKE